MKLAQAKQVAERDSAKNPGCTIYLCASFTYSQEMREKGDPPIVNENGYSTSDFYDGSIIARIVDGKWKDIR